MKKKVDTRWKPPKKHPWRRWVKQVATPEEEKLYQDYVRDNVRYNTPKAVPKKSFHS